MNEISVLLILNMRVTRLISLIENNAPDFILAKEQEFIVQAFQEWATIAGVNVTVPGEDR